MQAVDLNDQPSSITDATARLHAELDDLQLGRTPEDARFIVLDQDGMGFGVQFHRRVFGLQLALTFSRTAVFVWEHSPPYAPCFEPIGKFRFADTDEAEETFSGQATVQFITVTAE